MGRCELSRIQDVRSDRTVRVTATMSDLQRVAAAASHNRRADTPLPLDLHTHYETEFSDFSQYLRDFQHSAQSYSGSAPAVSDARAATPLTAFLGASLRLHQPFTEGQGDWDLEQIDGAARGWNPIRQCMSPLMYCTWSDPKYKGQHNWQPIELCDVGGVIAYMRRDADAARQLIELVERDMGKPYFVGDKEPLESDTPFGLYPGHPQYVPAPAVSPIPERTFSAREVKLAGHVQRQQAEQGIPVEQDISQVEITDLLKLMPSCLCCFCPVIITQDSNMQSVHEGRATIVDDSDVQDLSTTIGQQHLAASGRASIVYQPRTEYKEALGVRPED